MSDSKQEVVKKRKMDSKTTDKNDDIDPENPFTKQNLVDEVELKFDKGLSLFVSKSFLSYASPVFRRMFQSNFKEGTAATVAMKNKNYDDFLDLLLFLHPRIQKSISAQKAMEIYRLAHEYQIPPALQRAEDLIVERISSIDTSKCPAAFRRDKGKAEKYYNETFLDTAFELLMFAKVYANSNIFSVAAELISKVAAKIFINHYIYKQLSESEKNKLLLLRLNKVDDVEKVY